MDLAALQHFSSKTPVEHFVNSLCIDVNAASGGKKAAGRTYNSSPAA